MSVVINSSLHCRLNIRLCLPAGGKVCLHLSPHFLTLVHHHNLPLLPGSWQLPITVTFAMPRENIRAQFSKVWSILSWARFVPAVHAAACFWDCDLFNKCDLNNLMLYCSVTCVEPMSFLLELLHTVLGDPSSWRLLFQMFYAFIQIKLPLKLDQSFLHHFNPKNQSEVCHM